MKDEPEKLCVLYYRSRPSEPEANSAALQQQRAEAAQLVEEGYRVIADFLEVEAAAPDEGWAEDRPQFRQAYEMAKRVGLAHGVCELIILRCDEIGTGDEFEAASFGCPLTGEPVRIHWRHNTRFDAGLWSEIEHFHPEEEIPSDAFEPLSRGRYVTEPPDQIQMPQGATSLICLHVDLEPGRREAAVYLCNATEEVLEGRYEDNYSRALRHSPDIVDVHWLLRNEFRVEPGQCRRLTTFRQGDWRGETEKIRFIFRGSHEGLFGIAEIAGERFRQEWRPLAFTFQPESDETGPECVFIAKVGKKKFLLTENEGRDFFRRHNGRDFTMSRVQGVEIPVFRGELFDDQGRSIGWLCRVEYDQTGLPSDLVNQSQ